MSGIAGRAEPIGGEAGQLELGLESSDGAVGRRPRAMTVAVGIVIVSAVLAAGVLLRG